MVVSEQPGSGKTITQPDYSLAIKLSRYLQEFLPENTLKMILFNWAVNVLSNYSQKLETVIDKIEVYFNDSNYNLTGQTFDYLALVDKVKDFLNNPEILLLISQEKRLNKRVPVLLELNFYKEALQTSIDSGHLESIQISIQSCMENLKSSEFILLMAKNKIAASIYENMLKSKNKIEDLKNFYQMIDAEDKLAVLYSTFGENSQNYYKIAEFYQSFENKILQENQMRGLADGRGLPTSALAAGEATGNHSNQCLASVLTLQQIKLLNYKNKYKKSGSLLPTQTDSYNPFETDSILETFSTQTKSWKNYLINYGKNLKEYESVDSVLNDPGLKFLDLDNKLIFLITGLNWVGVSGFFLNLFVLNGYFFLIFFLRS